MTSKGQRAEHDVRKLLREMGYLVVRSGASITDLDLIAIHTGKKEIDLLQVKKGSSKYLNAEKKKYDHCKALDGIYQVKFKLVLCENGESISLEHLQGQEPD